MARPGSPHPGARWLSVAFERICEQWLDVWGAAITTPGAIAWLDDTPLGDEVARVALERRRREGA